MTQRNVLQVCRWLGYLSLCLFLCSWLPGCGGGDQAPAEKETEAGQQAVSAPKAESDQKPDADADVADAAVADQAVADAVPEPSTDEPTDGEPTDDDGSSANADEPAAPTKSGFSKFDMLMAALSIFVLSIFVGFEVITKVPPTLHTPLMSGSNAISGITLVGALLVAGQGDYAAWLGVLAVIFATINVIGGFWVTHRMLSMFQQR